MNSKTMTPNIELKIKLLRNKMIRIGCQCGLTNQETLRYSQKLDKLIFEYQSQKNQIR
ncbi:aspartyl-phosphate phosphatase Spo0E family protein [Neobacillus sp. D3-1R]|uniref:aspartyl-phosphate phosphatase Spo0E family protein n=1 Tax=Neobacillus sp. D3-1R TaxID=3445778 RepID=UPI003FA0045C